MSGESGGRHDARRRHRTREPVLDRDVRSIADHRDARRVLRHW